MYFGEHALIVQPHLPNLSSFRYLSILAILLFGIAVDVTAQSISLESSDAGGMTYTYRYTPHGSLPQHDEPLSLSDLASFLGEGWDESAMVALGQRGDAVMRVLEANSTEYRVTLTDEAQQALQWPLADLGPVGVFRTEPHRLLRLRMARYDEGVLRVYSHVRVRIDAAERSLRDQLGALTAPSRALQVTRSVLADGDMLRFSVSEEGIYRVDRDVISRMGLDPARVNPQHIRIYYNGHAPLPALNSAPRPEDLVEIPRWVVASSNTFGPNDAVYFYVRGLQFWQPSTNGSSWQHVTHPFSTSGAVFVRVREGDAPELALRMQQGTGTPLTQVTGRFILDLDEFMWSKEGGSGLQWFSQRIAPGSNRQLFTGSQLPGFTGGTVQIEALAAVQSCNVTPAASIRFFSNTTTLAQESPGAVSCNQVESSIAALRLYSFTFSSAPASFPLSFTLIQGGATAQTPLAAVDWVRAFFPQNLTASEGLLRFATPLGTPVSRYGLAGFSEVPEVWDVTDPLAPVRLSVTTEGNVRVVSAAGGREILAFVRTATRPLAGTPRRIAAQNLRGITDFPLLALITPDTLRAEAEQLAQRRRQQGLPTVVTTVNAIYNEFSGGVPDMRAVRDYLKFLYDRAPSADQRLRYALLFGDGHFNFRALGNTASLNNWIFPYQTDVSLNPIQSYTSDDYFGLLDDSEGLWDPSSAGREFIDIGIGRIPLQNRSQAQSFLRKVQAYEDGTTAGLWRTRYVFVADDGYTGSAGALTDDDLHLQNADLLAQFMEQSFPFLNQQKIYADVFERAFVGRWRVPGARDAFLRAIDDGALVFNYSGHGNPETLADEELFRRDDAERLTNLQTLPVFITATCSFGRWDLDGLQSAAEALVLNPAGGAIAAFTTVRIVYTSPNPLALNPGLNRAVNIGLFTLGEDGLPVRLGDAMLRAKNTGVGSDFNARKFNLLGDPSMRLGLPPAPVRLSRINTLVLSDTDTSRAPIRALDRITLQGQVQTDQGTLDTSANGVVVLTVYDVARQIPIPYPRYMNRPYFTSREDVLWRGQVPVRGGQFEATFVVPKDISYANQPGRIAAYARLNTQEGIGATERIRVGGSIPSLPEDTRGPEIRLFLADTTFVSGSVVPPNTELIVRLFDDTGINAAGAGVGHEMLLTVNGDAASAVNIGNRFEADPAEYRAGTVRFPLLNLPEGPGSLRVRAWDVMNNASVQDLDFVVRAAESLHIAQFLPFPNPTTGPTRFSFEHNQPIGTPADVRLRIFTVQGTPVRTLDKDEALPMGILSGSRVEIPWDGRDEDGSRLAPGVYLVHLRVRVEQPDGQIRVVERVERLAVLR